MSYDPQENTILIRQRSYPLPEESHELFLKMMKLFGRLGLVSSREVVSERKEELPANWKKVKKQQKHELITEFISSLKQRYDLSSKESRTLTALINIGFHFHALSHDDVVYEDGEVTEIKGLEFDEETRSFSIPPYAKVSQKAEKVVQPNILFNSIDRFLKENSKRAAKYRVRQTRRGDPLDDER